MTYLLAFITDSALIALASIIIMVLIICSVCAVFYYLKHTSAIKSSEAMLKNITENVNGGVFVLKADDDLTIMFANTGLYTLIGSPDITSPYFAEYLNADDLTEFKDAIKDARVSGQPKSLQLSLIGKDGEVPVILRLTVASDSDDKICRVYCVALDYTHQKNYYADLNAEAERYRIVFECSNDYIFDYDLKENRLICSQRLSDDYLTELITDDHIDELISPLDKAAYDVVLSAVYRDKQSHVYSRLRLKRRSGAYTWCDIKLSIFYNDTEPIRIVGYVSDVDDIVNERERLKSLTEKDVLTGLYNRAGFMSAVVKELEAGNKGAMFFIDIDDFKAVNDTYGHITGDKLLLRVADVMRAVHGPKDIAGRFAGDEFYMWIDRTTECVDEKAQKILDEIRKHFIIDGADVGTTVSIGIALYPEDADSYIGLVSSADKASYQRKSINKNGYTYAKDGGKTA